MDCAGRSGRESRLRHALRRGGGLGADAGRGLPRGRAGHGRRRGDACFPGVLLARYLGDSSEAAKRYFIELWRLLRPAIGGRAAVEPRIWRT